MLDCGVVAAASSLAESNGSLATSNSNLIHTQSKNSPLNSHSYPVKSNPSSSAASKVAQQSSAVLCTTSHHHSLPIITTHYNPPPLTTTHHQSIVPSPFNIILWLKSRRVLRSLKIETGGPFSVTNTYLEYLDPWQVTTLFDPHQISSPHQTPAHLGREAYGVLNPHLCCSTLLERVASEMVSTYMCVRVCMCVYIYVHVCVYACECVSVGVREGGDKRLPIYNGSQQSSCCIPLAAH